MRVTEPGSQDNSSVVKAILPYQNSTEAEAGFPLKTILHGIAGQVLQLIIRDITRHRRLCKQDIIRRKFGNVANQHKAWQSLKEIFTGVNLESFQRLSRKFWLLNFMALAWNRSRCVQCCSFPPIINIYVFFSVRLLKIILQCFAKPPSPQIAQLTFQHSHTKTRLTTRFTALSEAWNWNVRGPLTRYFAEKLNL